jgi:hypothetical protein
MKFFSILFIGLFMSSGLLHGMARLEQRILEMEQQRINDEIETKKNVAQTKADSNRKCGYLIGGVGFVMSMGIPAFFDEKHSLKHSTTTTCIYTFTALSLLGYGLNSIFCKVYENKVNNTFEVHGLCTRIKNKLINFSK